YDAGKFEQAAALWTSADRSERIVSSALARGHKFKDACQKVGVTALSFWISALQSAMFNFVLDWRLERGLLESLVDGDLAWKHSTSGLFPVNEAELATGELPARLAKLEISPSGPLWGEGMMSASPDNDPAQVENQALHAMELDRATMTDSKRSPEG